MKNIFSIGICFFIINLWLFSQNISSDSLEIKYNGVIKNLHDTTKLKQFFDICRQLEMQGDLNKPFNYYKKLRIFAEKYGNKSIQAECFVRMGNFYSNQAKFVDALLNNQAGLESIENEKAAKFKRYRSYFYNNNGNAYSDLGDYNRAFEQYQLSLKISEELSDSSQLQRVIMNIGVILLNLKKYEKAYEYFTRSYNIALKTKNMEISFGSLYNIALVYYEMKNYSKSLEYYSKVLELFSKKKDSIQIARILVFGGQINSQLKNEKIAEELINKGISISKKFNDEYAYYFGYLKLAEHYQDFEYYRKAIDYGKLSLTFFKERDLLDFSNQAYKLLSFCYSKIGDFRNAYHYLNEYAITKDSLASKDISNIISKYELNQEIQTNTQKINNLKKEHQIKLIKRNNIIVVSIISIVSLLLILILLYLRYRLKSKTNKKLAEHNATKDKFFSIISHDLKTPVQSFNKLTEQLSDFYNEFSDDEKQDYLKSLNSSSANILKLLENLLTWSRLQTENIIASPENFSINGLIKSESENLKEFSDKKNVRVILNDTLDTFVFADKEMIALVIRNLISNAIKYSYENSSVFISIAEENKFIKVSITDNGIGINNEDQKKLFRLDIRFSTIGTDNEKGTGLGLNLCNDFIKKNKGNIWFESQKEKGSVFYFTLPQSEINFNNKIERMYS